jgi:hypothetical protein
MSPPPKQRVGRWLLLSAFGLTFSGLCLALMAAPLSSPLALGSSYSFTWKEGIALPLARAKAPFSDYTKITGISGAHPGAYIDASFFYSQKDNTLNFGADGSGYYFRQYVGESALDYGVFALDIHHPISLRFLYAITESPTRSWSVDFYSGKGGSGQTYSYGFSAVAGGAQTLTLSIASLGLSFIPESLAITYHLDSIYSLFFYFNLLEVAYRCD